MDWCNSCIGKMNVRRRREGGKRRKGIVGYAIPPTPKRGLQLIKEDGRRRTERREETDEINTVNSCM